MPPPKSSGLGAAVGRLLAAAGRLVERPNKKPRANLNVPVATLAMRLVKDHGHTHVRKFAIAIGLMMLVAACTALSAYLMKDVINIIFVDRNQNALLWLPAVIAAIFIVKGLATYWQEVTIARIGNRIIAETQSKLFHHLLGMNVGYFQRTNSAELITMMTHNANSARDMMSMLALGLGRDLLTVIGLVIVMIRLDPVLSAIALIGGPIAILVVRRLVARIRKAASGEVASTSAIISTMRETAQGIRVAKAFQIEPQLEGVMGKSVGDVERRNNDLVRIQARVSPLMETLAGLAIAGVVLYSGWRSLSHGEPPGSFFAFIAALLLAAEPARRLAKLNLQLSSSAVGVQMMYQILDTPAPDRANDDRASLAVKTGDIRFDDVTFAYEPEKPALKSFSAHFRGGETAALVGLSGSGKSTVFNLLLRFWPLEAGHGRIEIDGQDITAVNLASLRAGMSLVSQDAFMFEGTIADNIRAGASDRDEAAVVAAAKAAYAHDFIMGFPRGYQTPVGELGGTLSGGQRQRISIARAFLKDAPIILLDEPTSALDSETEHAIQQALAVLTRNRTTIIIAHRFSTIQHADRIFVLQAGEVVEEGSHAELYAKGGVYRRLHSLQFAGTAA